MSSDHLCSREEATSRGVNDDSPDHTGEDSGDDEEGNITLFERW